MGLLLVLFTLSACNGSGSSGFDASSAHLAVSEQGTIDRVTKGPGTCVAVEGVAFCSPAR